jgi:uncharacterized cupin superfamily protein
MSSQRIANLADLALKDNGNGKSFQAKTGRAGPLLGLKAIGCTLVVVPPGKRAWPFHRHHVADELFYILSGSGEVRLDGETKPVRAGDLIGNPAGAEAHQIVNTDSQELRYLAFSNIESVDVIEYPDSGKIAAAAGIRNADFTTATIAKLGHLQEAGYFDGEEPA